MTDDPNQRLTKAECLVVLDKYKDWNPDQRSLALNFAGVRTAADDIYDARRKLLLAATQRLTELC